MLGPTLGRFLLVAAFWVVLVGAERGGLVVGGAVVPAVTWASVRLARPRPLRLRALVRLAPRLVAMSLAGSLDVARRALRRRPQLAPALVDVPVALEDPRSRLLLASLVSLIPGTVSVELGARTLTLHLLDASDRARARAVAEVGELEDSVRGLIEAPVARGEVRRG